MKRSFKRFIDKHGLKVIIGSAIFLLIGIGVFVLGGLLAGWNIVGWLTSPQAMFVYVAIGFFFLAILYIWFWSKRSNIDE